MSMCSLNLYLDKYNKVRRWEKQQAFWAAEGTNEAAVIQVSAFHRKRGMTVKQKLYNEQTISGRCIHSFSGKRS